MTASDYPVTFPYGATTAPYSPSYPHQGVDRAMPFRTPVVVNGVTIGYAGTTGFSTGVHTHLQKIKDHRVVNPGDGGFSIPEPVLVFDAGYDPDSIGRYVRLVDGDGVEWSWFHFDEITVKEGDNLNRMDKTYKELGYSEYKKDIEYVFGDNIPANVGYKLGYIPKYQFWTPRKFLRSVAQTQYEGKLKLKEELKNKDSEYEKVNEDLYRRK